MATELETLKAKIAELEGKLVAKRKLSYRVSAKKALSVYGLNARFPVTLYLPQWTRLLADAANMQAFINAHRGEFAVRED